MLFYILFPISFFAGDFVLVLFGWPGAPFDHHGPVLQGAVVGRTDLVGNVIIYVG